MVRVACVHARRFGQITRDFHQYYTTTTGAYYYQMKTSIQEQASIMYRLEILGYAYGASASIDSVTTGYTFSGEVQCVHVFTPHTHRLASGLVG